jgi:hypothetical protein
VADPRDLTTVDNVKAFLALPEGNDELDSLIPDFITEASVIIGLNTKRQFAPVEVDATHRFRVDDYRVDFSPFDLQTATQVLLHPETDEPISLYDASVGGASSEAYMLKPISPQRGVYQSLQFSGFMIIVSQLLMEFNYALLDVTGTWGFPEIPPDITRACNMTVASWLTRTAPASTASYGIPQMSGQGAMLHGSDWDIPWAAHKIIGRYKRGSARWAF